MLVFSWLYEEQAQFRSLGSFQQHKPESKKARQTLLFCAGGKSGDQARPLVAATETAVPGLLRELPPGMQVAAFSCSAWDLPQCSSQGHILLGQSPARHQAWLFLLQKRGWDAVFALQLHTRTTHKLSASPSFFLPSSEKMPHHSLRVSCLILLLSSLISQALTPRIVCTSSSVLAAASWRTPQQSHFSPEKHQRKLTTQGYSTSANRLSPNQKFTVVLQPL